MDETTGAFGPDPRPTDELIRTALAQDPEGEEYWETVSLLEYRGTEEVFEAAARMCNSHIDRERLLCAGIMAWVGYTHGAYNEQSVALLIPLLEDKNSEVIATAVRSLGKRKAVEAIERILQLKDHPDEAVREAVATALGDVHYTDIPSGCLETLAEDLISLSRDPNRSVRNEATWSLAFWNEATPEVVAALQDRTKDEDDEIRADALMGLAQLRYPGVVELIINELSTREWIHDDTLDAAAITKDPRLLPILQELKEEGFESTFLDDAIHACSGNQGA
jgi:hypothetical protein